ncbi:hypothetical protein M514_23536 [Trichuris suis]|uniref:Uncharacterized protein n=1 Tax=Trichuris suis TaxID=68888 RepID=A0A085N456_9BILA|nr:hypothetical protein M514_23536 [Trichuris suis]
MPLSDFCQLYQSDIHRGRQKDAPWIAVFKSGGYCFAVCFLIASPRRNVCAKKTGFAGGCQYGGRQMLLINQSVAAAQPTARPSWSQET